MMGGGAPAGEAPAGEAPGGAPPAGEMPAGEMPGAAPGGEMGGMGAPAGGGATAEVLETKHAGDWAAARAQLEQILAANPSDAEAHRILAWILADREPQAAIEHFNKFLESGAGSDQQKADAQAAVERLQAR